MVCDIWAVFNIDKWRYNNDVWAITSGIVSSLYISTMLLAEYNADIEAEIIFIS